MTFLHLKIAGSLIVKYIYITLTIQFQIVLHSPNTITLGYKSFITHLRLPCTWNIFLSPSQSFKTTPD